EELIADVGVLVILAGEQVKRALAMAGVDLGVVADLDLRVDGPVFLAELVIDERAPGVVRVGDGFEPTDTAAEAHEDDVGALVIGLGSNQFRFVAGVRLWQDRVAVLIRFVRHLGATGEANRERSGGSRCLTKKPTTIEWPREHGGPR